VALASSNGSAASGPSTVTVSPGASSASFTINTGGVSAATSVTLTASYAGVNKTAILTVNPAAGITGANSQNITPTGATIVWTTNVPATSGVKYGSTSGYGCASPSDPNMVLSHSVNLTGLMPNTLYHFQAVSVDASGNQAVSADSTFTTSPGVEWSSITGSPSDPQFSGTPERPARDPHLKTGLQVNERDRATLTD
jgi:hypothetical protein